MTARPRLYLDHAATTPVLPEARAAMADALERWANPSSPHSEGRAARSALERARAQIAEALGWRHDVILTSGASEAIAIAAARAKASARFHCATEHDAVVGALADRARALPVDGNGVVDPGALDEAISKGGALIAVQQVNNETGVIQQLDAVAERVRASGSLLLADCAQSAGKLPLPDADFIAVSAHKLGGPPGIGALLVRDIASLAPGGGQEKGYRRGTENLPAAAGFAAALASRAFAGAMPRLGAIRRKLDSEIANAGGIVIAFGVERSPAIACYAMRGLAGTTQLVQLDLAGIAVSVGAACSSGSMKPSRVLAAMGLEEEVAGSAIRVSFGPDTAEEDVDRFFAEWRRLVERAKARAA